MFDEDCVQTREVEENRSFSHSRRRRVSQTGGKKINWKAVLCVFCMENTIFGWFTFSIWLPPTLILQSGTKSRHFSCQDKILDLIGKKLATQVTTCVANDFSNDFTVTDNIFGSLGCCACLEVPTVLVESFSFFVQYYRKLLLCGWKLTDSLANCVLDARGCHTSAF